MNIFLRIRAWWAKIPQEKRDKFLYEVRSIATTFLAAFLIQMAVDIQTSNYAIPVDVAAGVSFFVAAVRAGVKATLRLFVDWVGRRFLKK